MSSYNIPVVRGLYAAVLSKDDPSPLLPKSDEELADAKEEDEKKSEEIFVTIDENVLSRIIALDLPLRNYTGLVSGPKNTVFVSENVPNETGITLHKYDVGKLKSSEFISGIRFAQTSADRKQLLYRLGNNWGIVETSGKSKKAQMEGSKLT